MESVLEYQKLNEEQDVLDIDVGQQKKILFLGDSFTIGTGLEADQQEEAFPYQLVKKLKENHISIVECKIYAIDGDTTKHLLGALNVMEPQSNPDNESYQKDNYDLVVLSIGINDLFRGHSREDYKHHFEELLNRSIRFAKDDLSRVIVLSIPCWDASPSVYNESGLKFRANKYETVQKNINEISVPISKFKIKKNGKIQLVLTENEFKNKIESAKMYNTRWGIATEIDSFNEAVTEVIAKYNIATEGEEHKEIHFIDLTYLTRENATDYKTEKPISDLFAEDDIHYSAKMYQKWSETGFPIAYKILKT